jgi:hypothetical protein
VVEEDDSVFLVRHDVVTTLPQMLGSCRGHGDEPANSRDMVALDQASIVGLLPDGETWTRCPPCIEYLRVWAWSGAQPLEEVKNQAVHRVAHRPRSSRAL